jgi:hypothetical protein
MGWGPFGASGWGYEWSVPRVPVSCVFSGPTARAPSPRSQLNIRLASPATRAPVYLYSTGPYSRRNRRHQNILLQQAVSVVEVTTMLLQASLAAPGLRPARPHGEPTHVARGEPTANKHSYSSSRSSDSAACDTSTSTCREALADARCYAARYPELRALFCAGGSSCRSAELLNHFRQHGRKKNRTYHCFRPTPYAESRNRILRLWPPEGTVPSDAAANQSVILFRHVEKTSPSPSPSCPHP